MNDKNVTPFDIMNDTVLFNFFQNWGAQILFAIAVWYIIEKLKTIDRKGIRRDNIAKLTQIRVESIAHALGNAPAPIGEHFKVEYDKKVNELLKQENFIDTNSGN
jgi:hypothetical protein